MVYAKETYTYDEVKDGVKDLMEDVDSTKAVLERCGVKDFQKIPKQAYFIYRCLLLAGTHMTDSQQRKYFQNPRRLKKCIQELAMYK